MICYAKLYTGGSSHFLFSSFTVLVSIYFYSDKFEQVTSYNFLTHFTSLLHSSNHHLTLLQLSFCCLSSLTSTYPHFISSYAKNSLTDKLKPVTSYFLLMLICNGVAIFYQIRHLFYGDCANISSNQMCTCITVEAGFSLS